MKNKQYRVLFIIQTLDNLRFNGNFFESNFGFSKKIVDYELETLEMNNIYNFKFIRETLNINNISFVENVLRFYLLEKIDSIKKCPDLEKFFLDKELKLLKEIN